MKIRIINGPTHDVIEMISKRMRSDVRARMEKVEFNAVALMNAAIPDIFYYADVASKASAVLATDISGTCPQHITTLVLFGDVAAIKTAVEAIKLKEMK